MLEIAPTGHSFKPGLRLQHQHPNELACTRASRQAVAKRVRTIACYVGCNKLLCSFVPWEISFITAPVGSMRKLKSMSTKSLPASMYSTRLLDFCTSSCTRTKSARCCADSHEFGTTTGGAPGFLAILYSSLADHICQPCSSVITWINSSTEHKQFPRKQITQELQILLASSPRISPVQTTKAISPCSQIHGL